MAEISVTLQSVGSEVCRVNELLSFELVRELDAVCDGLSLSYIAAKEPFEIDRVTVFLGGEKVFYGYCDRQRYSKTKKGYEVQIYARSSAAVLLDNEAQPAEYNAPSVNTLFCKEVEKSGFKNKLPRLGTKYVYNVAKGTTCYGAVNDFVKTLTSKDVLINPENELYIPDGKGVINLDDESIISETRCINRARPVTCIDYKSEDDSAYIRHYKSRYFEDKGIKRSRKTDVSSLPLWQRENALKNRLLIRTKGYYEVQFVLDGLRCCTLYDRAVCRESRIDEEDNLRLSRFVMKLDENGERTRLVFRKEIDLKEVNYVAE